MSGFKDLIENFEILKKMFVTMSHAVQQLEQRVAMLEKEKKNLIDMNKSLQESLHRVLDINKKQLSMLGSLDKSLDTIEYLKKELDDIKKENLKLKDSSNNQLQSIQLQHPYLDNCSQKNLENYNSLLQKKIVDLEKQLLNQKLVKQNSCVNNHDANVIKLKENNNILTLENRSLKEQILNLRDVHNQIISEIRLNTLKESNNRSQHEINNTACTSSMGVNSITLNQNELQPLQINVIYSDIEDDV